MTNEIIEDQDISFIVQGEFSNYTDECINSIKINFPRSEIILSTWKNDNNTINNTNLDYLVINDDPGTFFSQKDKPFQYNLDRQLVSTRGGIEKASRKYIAKVRSDLFFLNTNFLKKFSVIHTPPSEYKIFSNPILITSVYTRNPLKVKKNHMLFHVGDFFYFGTHEDIKKLFDIPLAGQKIANYFLDKEQPSPYLWDVLFKYTPEQYIFLKNLQKITKFRNIDLIGHTKISYKLFILHLKFMANNFFLLNWNESGIISLKHKNIDEKDLYHEDDFNEIKNDVTTNNLLKYKVEYFFHIIIKSNLKKIEKNMKKNLRFRKN